MPLPAAVSTVEVMNTTGVLRWGAVLAVAGAACQLLATLTEPVSEGSPEAAMRALAQQQSWTANRLLDLTGSLLTVGGLAVAAHTGRSPGSRDWFRAGLPFLILMGALGAGAVLVGASLRDLALAGAGSGGEYPAYVVAFDTVRELRDALFFGAFLALGLYLATLSAALVGDPAYRSWLGWLAAVAAGLLLVGDPLQLVADPAFVLVLAGFAGFLMVSVGVGTSLWRQAGRSPWPTLYPPSRRHAEETPSEPV
jgi:hypothetical protein